MPTAATARQPTFQTKSGHSRRSPWARIDPRGDLQPSPGRWVFMPLCGHCGFPSRSVTSLNDLVGAGEERLRHGQAELFRGLQVNNQLECRRLLDRQIGWLGATEDLSDVNPKLAIDERDARPIADQASSVDELAPFIDCRNSMA